MSAWPQKRRGGDTPMIKVERSRASWPWTETFRADSEELMLPWLSQKETWTEEQVSHSRRLDHWSLSRSFIFKIWGVQLWTGKGCIVNENTVQSGTRVALWIEQQEWRPKKMESDVLGVSHWSKVRERWSEWGVFILWGIHKLLLKDWRFLRITPF